MSERQILEATASQSPVGIALEALAARMDELAREERLCVSRCRSDNDFDSMWFYEGRENAFKLAAALTREALPPPKSDSADAPPEPTT